MSPPEAPDRNSETFIKCPVEGCDAVLSAQEMDQHILQSAGDGHGRQGEVPEDFSLDDLKEVEAPENESNYPAKHEVGKVARLCPYCEQPFTGKHGVLNHLEQTADQQDHPSNAVQVHESRDFPVVELDADGNVVAAVNSPSITYGDATPGEQQLEEGAAFAGFSKDEVDYLYETISSEIDDERARRILQRAFVDQSDVSHYHTIIEDDVRLTYDVVVTAGCKIGENAMIGSRAIVTKDIPAHHIAVGTPARSIRVKPGYEDIAEPIDAPVESGAEERLIERNVDLGGEEALDEFRRDR